MSNAKSDIETAQLRADNERLRALVAELLPLVAELAEFSSPDMEYGACAWYDWHPDLDRGCDDGDGPHAPGCPVYRAKAITSLITSEKDGPF